ncbi:hypothetical protein GW17_00057842 [Ensete ventricosum]|nr:hypothetical protein GW17_00057842 [Ensete ventricosum]
MKKRDGHKLYKVEFRSTFCAPSRKIKILAIPNVLAHEKLYEHGFMKNTTVHKVARKVES